MLGTRVSVSPLGVGMKEGGRRGYILMGGWIRIRIRIRMTRRKRMRFMHVG